MEIRYNLFIYLSYPENRERENSDGINLFVYLFVYLL